MAYAIAVQRESGNRWRLVVTGQLDLSTVPLLEEELAQARAARLDLILDLSGLEFMDSHGAKLLAAATEQARAGGLSLDIAPNIPAQVRRLFELTRFLLAA